ncbi:MAG TPA: carbonate dehydratase [Gemmatimonadaceae bacterium]|nr:carbonate dehydratase [Gemmatimonadaceae bacterium]
MTLQDLIANNRAWAQDRVRKDPAFFDRLLRQQAPRYLWIGCSDSRVPANEIVGLLPGELFVHRNVANLVVHSDLNCLAVIQYAVEALRVQHIIVCGHYGCGGVEAAYRRTPLGLIDNWLCHVQDVADRHRDRLAKSISDEQRTDRLAELNVIEQALNVSRTTVLQDAWRRGQSVSVHGWIYRLRDGLIRDLGFTASWESDVAGQYASALETLTAKGAGA